MSHASTWKAGESALSKALDDQRSERRSCNSSAIASATSSFTLDRYGRPMPGHEEEAVHLLDAYLDHTTGA